MNYRHGLLNELMALFCFVLFAVIFNIYSTDGIFVHKEHLERRIFACDGGNIPQTVNECFSKVSITFYLRLW